MHHPTDRIAHTTAFVTPVVEHWLEREIAQWVHPMKDRSDDRSHHERTLLPQSYISLQLLHGTYSDPASVVESQSEVEVGCDVHLAFRLQVPSEVLLCVRVVLNINTHI